MFSRVWRPTPRTPRPAHLWQLVSAALIACAALFLPASSLVRAQANGPSVHLTKARVSPPAGSVPVVGDTLVFDITVTNNGSTVLTTVPLSDTFDLAILKFVGATLSAGGAPAVSAPPDIVQSNLVGWNDLTTLAGDLAVGASITVQTSFTAINVTQPGGGWETVVTSGPPANQPTTDADGFPATPNEFYDLETKFVIKHALDHGTAPDSGGIFLAVKGNGDVWPIIPDVVYGFKSNTFTGYAKHPGGQSQCTEYFIREYQRLQDTGRTIDMSPDGFGIQTPASMLGWARNCADFSLAHLIVCKQKAQPADVVAACDPQQPAPPANPPCTIGDGNKCLYLWGFYDPTNAAQKYWYNAGEGAQTKVPDYLHLSDSYAAWTWAELAQTLQAAGDPTYTRYRDAAQRFWDWANTVGAPYALKPVSGKPNYSARDRFWTNLGTTLSYIYDAEGKTAIADALRAEVVNCVNQTANYAASKNMQARCNGESYSSAYGRAPASISEQLRGRDHYVEKDTWHQYGGDGKFVLDPAKPKNPTIPFSHGGGREYLAGVQRADWFYYSYPTNATLDTQVSLDQIPLAGPWTIESWARYGILGYWKYARDKMWDNTAGQQAWWESSSYLYKPCFSLGTPLPIGDWRPPTIGNKIHTLNPDGSATVTVSGVQDTPFPYLGWQFKGIGVRDVKVFYRYESDPNPNNWIALPTTPASPGSYTATIPASPNEPDTVFYYAEAADEFGNRSTFPSGAGGPTGTYQIYTRKYETYNVAWVNGASDGTRRAPPTQTQVSTKVTPKPTAVTLASFAAQMQDGTTHVRWQTASEQNNYGFRVYRSTTPSRAGATVISPLLAGQGRGSNGGAVYSFVDSNPPPGPRYYWLEAIDLAGTSEWYGPAGIAPQRADNTVFLPLVRR